MLDGLSEWKKVLKICRKNLICFIMTLVIPISSGGHPAAQMLEYHRTGAEFCLNIQNFVLKSSPVQCCTFCY